MLAHDRTALICDLAETYHIFDYRALPVQTLAALACGLRADSRIKLKWAGIKEASNEVLLVQIFDILQLMRYQFFASKKDAPPKLLSELLIEKEPPVPDEKRDRVLAEILETARQSIEGDTHG